jgi:flagellar hook-basal body complex protein FliE
MSDITQIAAPSTADLLKQKEALATPSAGGEAFAQHLKSAINEVNDLQKDAELATADIATGQVKDLHQAALAIGKAETSMKLMLEIRNKALNAYKEIGRTQI